MITALNYNEISMQEKFIMIEELWQSLSHNAQDKGFTPDWHLDVLAHREEKLKSCESSFSDLESVKARLQKLI